MGPRVHPDDLAEAIEREAKWTKMYAITCGEYIKIGLAEDVYKRMRTFKIGNPYPMKVVATRNVKFRDAIAAEREVHATFAHCRHRGEWFKAPLDEVRKEMSRVVSAYVKAALARQMLLDPRG